MQFNDDWMVYREWTELIPNTPTHNGVPTSGDVQPFGRGWSFFAMDTNRSEILMWGGNGVSAGDSGRHGETDHDYDGILVSCVRTYIAPVQSLTITLVFFMVIDLWIYSVATNTWRSPTICESYDDVCSDSSKLVDFYNLTSLMTALTTAADISSRPSEQAAILAEYRSLIDEIRGQLTGISVPSPPTDDPSLCSKVCVNISKPAVYPYATEGHRGHIIGDNYWQLFGYSCTADGSVVLGGSDCFRDSVWQLDLTTGIWIHYQDSTNALWPSPRAYHGQSVHENRIWIVGGAYIGYDGVYYYLNDVHCWDTTTLQWISLSVGGATHPVGWSLQIQVIGDKLYSWGGCRTGAFNRDLMILLLNAEVKPDQLQAEGTGLVSCNAGDTCTFILSARDWSNTSGTKEWGALLPYATGLDLVVSIVPSASNGLLHGSITDFGDGQYGVSYQALLASQSYKIFVSLDGVNIIEEGFTVTIIAGTPVASKFVMSSLETLLYADVMTSFTIKTADVYGNLRTNSTNDNTTLLTITPSSLGAVITNQGDGTYVVAYMSPASGSFSLSIMYDSIPVLGSPFECSIIVSTEQIAKYGDTIEWRFDGSIAILSFGMSVLGSWTALILMEEVNVAVSRARRTVFSNSQGGMGMINRCYRHVWFVWTIFTSLSLGICALWNNVTLAVSSIRFPHSTNVTLTMGPLIIAALAVSIVTMTLALTWVVRGQRHAAVASSTTLSPTYASSKVVASGLKWRQLVKKCDARLLYGGIFIMLACWCTQILAIYSINVPASVTLHAGLSIVSLVIAYVMCTPAILLYLHFQSSLRWIAAFIMSGGICASTYTHLSGLTFVYDTNNHHDFMSSVGVMQIAASATTLACCFVLLGIPSPPAPLIGTILFTVLNTIGVNLCFLYRFECPKS
jgi:hypothetical protein